ncbi:RluA family pseudouridine synthase [Bacillus sp. N9]
MLDIYKKGDHRKIRHVQRLDKDTSGAILFAKHSLSHAILDRMLLNHQIERVYIALADGLMKESRFTINEPIGRDRYHPTKRRVSKTGQLAKTDFQVCHTFPNKRLTLVECRLNTGRTHQIRVHLSHIGHPLAGDRLYGGRPIFPRQALHAKN